MIDNNCPDGKLHFGMAGGSNDYDDVGDEIDKRDDIPTAREWWQAATELERFDLGTCDVDRYEGDDGNDADVDYQDEASQADAESMENLEDWGHCTR